MPLSNITTINLSLQSQGAAFVAREIAKLAQPARRLYVFGGASNVFPYFTTTANAETYALALSPAPSKENPVNIVLLSASNGSAVKFTGDWYAKFEAGIIYESSLDPWKNYVLYGGTLTEADLLWDIDESKLSITVQG
jgi:hypothetical protein